jgi:hypothetical protein
MITVDGLPTPVGCRSGSEYHSLRATGLKQAMTRPAPGPAKDAA